MKKLNITRGKVRIGRHTGLSVLVQDGTARVAMFDPKDGFANATLYADAHNTYHVTGMLPSEMAERIKALEDALDRCANDIEETILFLDEERDPIGIASGMIASEPKMKEVLRRARALLTPINEAHASIITKPE